MCRTAEAQVKFSWKDTAARKIFTKYRIPPEEMDSNNSILRLGLFSNQVQVNCGSVTTKYTMRWTVLFKISKDLLLQGNVLNNSLPKHGTPTVYILLKLYLTYSHA
jgi:hypothetical protein